MGRRSANTLALRFRQPALDSWTLQTLPRPNARYPRGGDGAPVSVADRQPTLETWTLPGPFIPAADRCAG
eukprot:3492432-Pyramimonas_sp.AAC.1